MGNPAFSGIVEGADKAHTLRRLERTKVTPFGRGPNGPKAAFGN
jgi:hypothetical protein